jgi:hypothetical protein
VINIFVNEYDLKYLDLLHVVFVKESFFCQIFERLLMKDEKVFRNVTTFFFMKFQLHVLRFLTDKHSLFLWLICFPLSFHQGTQLCLL